MTPAMAPAKIATMSIVALKMGSIPR